MMAATEERLYLPSVLGGEAGKLLAMEEGRDGERGEGEADRRVDLRFF